MSIQTSLFMIVPWAAGGFFWRRRSFEAARISAAVGTWILAFVASYHWQAYGRTWAMAVPFLLGMVALTACGRAKGEGLGAMGKALLAVGLPIFFMLLTFNYFQKMFLLIRATATVRERVHYKGDIQDLPASEKGEAVQALTAALGHDDVFVKYGALHLLRLTGPAAAVSADAAAKALLGTREDDPSRAAWAFRRDGVRFLGGLATDGVPALLTLIRDGDPTLKSEALWSLSQVGPPAKDAALHELARMNSRIPQDLDYRFKGTRKGLGIEDAEWERALASAAQESSPAVTP